MQRIRPPGESVQGWHRPADGGRNSPAPLRHRFATPAAIGNNGNSRVKSVALRSEGRLMFRFLVRSFALILGAAGTVQAEDWPQWRGPERNGVTSETAWLAKWPEGASPRVAWRAGVGKGHAAVSIAAGRAFTMGWDGKEDTVFCFDAATGRLIWKQSYPCRTILQWPGPRATPTVHDDSVYTLGQHGQLRAWDARTGKPLWQRDLPQDYNPDVDYGFAWSPLVLANLLILSAGSRGLALRTGDGSVAWGDDRRKGTCVSAVLFEHDGQRGRSS